MARAGTMPSVRFRVECEAELHPELEWDPEVHAFCTADANRRAAVGRGRAVELEVAIPEGAAVLAGDVLGVELYAMVKSDDCPTLNNVGSLQLPLGDLLRAGTGSGRLVKVTYDPSGQEATMGWVERAAARLLLRPTRRFGRVRGIARVAIVGEPDLEGVALPPRGARPPRFDAEAVDRVLLSPFFEGGRFVWNARHPTDGSELVPTVPFASNVMMPLFETPAGPVPGKMYFDFPPSRGPLLGAMEPYFSHLARETLDGRDPGALLGSPRAAGVLLAEFATAYAVSLPYGTDYAVVGGAKKYESVESFDDPRIRRAGDCEDFSADILRVLDELASGPWSDPLLVALQRTLDAYLPVAALSIAEADRAGASVGGGAGGGVEQAHMTALLVPRGQFVAAHLRCNPGAGEAFLEALAPSPHDAELRPLVMEGTARIAPDLVGGGEAREAGTPPPLWRPLDGIEGVSPVIDAIPERAAAWKPWYPARPGSNPTAAERPPQAARLTSFFRLLVHAFAPALDRLGFEGHTAFTFVYASRPDGRPVDLWCYGVQFEDVILRSPHVGLFLVPPLTPREVAASREVLRRIEPPPRLLPPEGTAAEAVARDEPRGIATLSRAAAASRAGSAARRDGGAGGPARSATRALRVRPWGASDPVRYSVPQGAMSEALARRIVRRLEAGGHAFDVRLRRIERSVARVDIDVHLAGSI